MFDSFLELIEKGGVLMYPIILLSLVSLAIFLERIFSLRAERYAPAAFLEKLYESLGKKDLQTAAAVAEADKSAVAKISKDILHNLDLPLTRLMEAAEESGRYHSKQLDRYLPTLQTIASVSPLLGLLGTVIGMIKTFIIIGSQGVGDAQALAGGISEALLTTAAGLSVAIPTMIFYYIVRHRSERVTMELEKSTSMIVNLIFKEGDA
ncbi:MotA/TolQ/ExbB proton channel family protein [Limisalsivibrio acetivorans]|uniref:MotA/TolQ/ExbB proton channel family protein n=1 Tax=Limisalsivibrio acetivorans TaxID=1304888 RepID=UPI0003B60644|nr:MotA/TolQ/ExbB proton channel family protein [Limisalsivibrio acetivorans]